MDNLTHTLFGAMLARTPLARAGRGATAALLLASNAPDVDIVAAIGGSASYLRWHRGPTHGVLGVVGLGVATAGIVWAVDRVMARRSGARTEAPNFAMLTAVSMLAVVLHILMDLPTSYGTRVLSPFDWHWYAFDWVPIIDVYLLIILVLGLVFAATSKASARRMAAIVFLLMGANYGLRATAHHQAVDRAAANLGPLLTACDPQSTLYQGELAVWPRSRKPADLSRGSCLVEIAAVPTFVSPFRWRVIAQLTNGYELRELNLLDARQDDGSERMARLSIRYPNIWTPAVGRAADTRTAAIFLGFSRFPSARSFVDKTGAATVRLSDMRFTGGLFTLQNRGTRPDPFTVTVRLSPDGRVLEERMGTR